MPPTKRRSRPVEPRICNIAKALHLVGDRWAMLAMREVLLGADKFDEIIKNTGVARNILTARLNSLVEAGLLVRDQYSDRPPRSRYLPTPAGRDLQAVLQVLMAWGDRHLDEHDGPPTVLVHSCGETFEAAVTCACCGEAADEGSLRVTRLGGIPVAGPSAKGNPGASS